MVQLPMFALDHNAIFIIDFWWKLENPVEIAKVLRKRKGLFFTKRPIKPGFAGLHVFYFTMLLAWYVQINSDKRGTEPSASKSSTSEKC